MYYFVPKAANRPVYSYRLSIVHFWSLIFFIHLGRTTPFIIFCICQTGHKGLYFQLCYWRLLGMINGLLTLRGAWDKVRVDGIKILCSCDYWLWNGYFEGPMFQCLKCNCAFHRLDYCTRSRGSISLEWIYGFWYDLLVDSKNDKGPVFS
jgi:cytochrome c oxidase cbb3-type subunit I/II